MSENGRRRLTSWKEIASHLGRDVRTVLRWEKERGLPIHRVPGATGRVVFAYTEELDAWARGELPPVKPAPPQSAAAATAPGPAQTLPAEPAPAITRHRSRWLAAAAAVAIVLSAVAWRVGVDRDAEAAALTIRFTDNALIAATPQGAERWRHELKREETTIPVDVRHEQPGEIFGRDIVVATSYSTRKSDGVIRSGELLRLSPDGRLKGTFAFDDVPRFDGTFGPPWLITDFRIDHSTPAPRIVVAAHHNEWWPSTVTILDEHWKRRGTFVNAGWVERVHWLAPDRIVIGGFSNALDGGMVALLDANAMDGQSPAPHGSPFVCASCGPGGPLRYVVMARSEVNKVSGAPFNRVVLLAKEGALLARTIEATASEFEGAADALYEFTPALELVRASYSDRYWEKHRDLEAAGKIAHPRESCPDRDGPREIRVWEPETGWTPVTIAPSRAPSSPARNPR